MSAAPLEHFGNGVLKAWVEIPLPSPVGWSFEAPGWRLLLAAVLCLTVWQGWQMWRRWLADAYRRDGLAELDALRHDEPDWQRRLQRMPVIMKSVALHGFGRHQVAHLSGDAWYAFVQARSPKPIVSEADWAVLQAADYQPCVSWRFDQLAAERCALAVRAWIAEHRGRDSD